MRWYERLLWVTSVLLLCSAVWAGEEVTAPAQSAPTGTNVEAPAPEAASPAAATLDERALSPDEFQSLRTSADSLAGNQDLQNMQAGAGINGTLVLSILVALVIFAVLISVL